MTAVPETRYVKSGDVHIAYQVVGDGPIDLVFVPGFVSNLEGNWQQPARAAFFRRLASFSRLILFDKRGTGMSDRTSQIFTLEQRMEDVNAVMDAAQSKRAALFGISEGGPMAVLFAASYPQRTNALVVYGSYAKRSRADDHPFGWPEEKWAAVLEGMERNWGTANGVDLELWAPSIAHDPERAAQWAAYIRSAASPGAALAVMNMNRDIDVRRVLASVGVPTLILHRVDERVIDIEQARYLARHIPGAKLVELPGADHIPWVGDSAAIIDEVELFLTGQRQAAEPERVLATVQFTDIVQSTERAAALGDRRWRGVLEQFQSMVREALREHRGREIDTAGDGFLAAFDGPARAIRCAASIRAGARARTRNPRGRAHRRVRADRRQARRHRGPHRRSRCRHGGSRRDRGFADRKGSRRRLRPHFCRARHAFAQGRARGVAALRFRGLKPSTGRQVNKGLAFVTGAGSGIGRACALELGKRGFAVAAIDLDEKSAQETAGQIPGARAFRADVSNGAQVDAAVTAAAAHFGPIEVLVNNAGILDGYFNADEMDEALWRKVIDIDLTGAFLVAKRALRDMLPRGRGRIINIASVAGLNGTGGGAAYIAAKHGVVGLTRQMAVVYGSRGITVNCVCPGAIPTGLRTHSQAILGPGVPDMSNRGVAVHDDQVRSLVPLGVRGTVADVAGAVCFLASPEASYINGHSLVVDGGWRAK